MIYLQSDLFKYDLLNALKVHIMLVRLKKYALLELRIR